MSELLTHLRLNLLWWYAVVCHWHFSYTPRFGPPCRKL